MNLRIPMRPAGRLVAGILTALALVLGLGGVQTAQAATVTAAQHCQQERQDVRAAKVKVKKAKKAKKKAVKAKKAKAVKKADKRLKKAKRNLERQRTQASRWCSRAKNETAVDTRGEETKAGYEEAGSGPAAQSLPDSLRSALEGAVAAAQAHVDTVLARVPTASSDELAHLMNELAALDPTGLQMAVEDLAAQLQTAGGDPAALSALVEGLLGNVAEGTPVPTDGGLADLQAALQSVVAQLGAFDPSATSPDALAGALDGLTDQLGSAAPQLTSLFAMLAGLGGGSVPSDPTALLELINDALAGLVGGSGTSDTLTDLLGGLLGGLGH